MKQSLVRDLSWLSFNERVLQEAQDPNVHLNDRLRFLGIFSNNLDEFFRVRVATLTKMVKLGAAAKVHLEQNPKKILRQIQQKVLEQQQIFDTTYQEIISDLEEDNIFIKTEDQLTEPQQDFIRNYFNEKVRTEIVPLMIESIPGTIPLRDKSIYLACVLGSTSSVMLQRFAILEIPTRVLPRFIILPSEDGSKNIILLEDIIRFNLPTLFASFGFNRYLSSIIKVTRDAEMDIDNDIHADIITQIEKGIKNRKRGKATRFVYERSIDERLLQYLTRRLNLVKKDNLIAGGRIHNFKDFMSFPSSVFDDRKTRSRPFVHPLLLQPCRIMQVIDKQDVMLHFPYHSFDSIIDLLREAAIDPFVLSIKITCYRLSKDSKVVNALINAVRNGKQVTVVMEVRARFDEEANLMWKIRLEDEGVKVVLGLPDKKVHAKLCVIKKKEFNKINYYAFLSTGNFNESTAQFYSDHCLITKNIKLISDANRIFAMLESLNQDPALLRGCHTLGIAPLNIRENMLRLFDEQIKLNKKKKPSKIYLKMNSLSDETLINKLYETAKAGVEIKCIIRGICCASPDQKILKDNLNAISIIDQYLEHARVFVFFNEKKHVFISSADWMVRNLDHRVEVLIPIFSPAIQQELIDILNIQLHENVKARILDSNMSNSYVTHTEQQPEIRSQVEIYKYLQEKTY